MTALSRALWRLSIRVALFLCALALLWSFGPLIWHLLSPFLIAIPVAALLQGPIRWGERHLRLKHGISVGIWVALVCAAFVALLYWLLATVAAQVIQLSGSYTTLIADGIGLLRGVVNRIFDALDYFPQAVEEWIRAAMNDAFVSLSAWATRMLAAVFNTAIGFASSIPYGLIYLNFLILGIFFISADYGGIKTRIMGLMGETVRTRSQMLSVSAWKGLWGYVKVQLLFGVLVLAVSWPCLSLFHVPYPFLIAFIAALLEFLPIFGNGTLYIPWAIVCYIIGLPVMGTQMLVLHLALYTFRRVTEPKLLSHQIGLSPLLSLVSIFVGMQLGGVLGLMLAPVVMVVLRTAWQGGLFAGAVGDMRIIYTHVSDRLREPEA